MITNYLNPLLILIIMTTLIIVDKNGTLKTSSIKEYKEEDLFKKCGFRKADGFNKDTEWKLKIDGTSYIVKLYGKTTGRANSENKYDFPPPSDNTLFFGSCLLIGFQKTETTPCDLSLELWEKMYEKLFGGFEDLAATQAEDDAEVDELASIDAKFKTKDGYLKDGFVVDDNEESSANTEEGDVSFSTGEEDATSEYGTEDADELLENVLSELEEDEYDYSDEEDIEIELNI